nr:hypothetical protein [uncultured Pedobacter sp.]
MSQDPHLIKVVALVCCCIGLLITKVNYAQTNEIVGYINKQPIEQVEVNREMENHKSEVMNKLAKEYHLNSLSNFWSREFEGVKSVDILKKIAWEALVKAKVQEQLFSSQNLWSFKNYSDLKQQMKQVNAKRLKLKSTGKVIYGPVLFTEKTFYEYEFSNAIIKVKDKLYPRPIAEAKLINHYNELKKTVYANSNSGFKKLQTRVETSYIDKEYNNLITEKVKSAQVIIK